MTYRQRTDDPTLVCTVMAADSLKTPKAGWTIAGIPVPVAQDGMPEGFLLVKRRDSVAVEGGLSNGSSNSASEKTNENQLPFPHPSGVSQHHRAERCRVAMLRRGRARPREVPAGKEPRL